MDQQSFTSESLSASLRASGLGLGQPLTFFDRITSTNDEALRAARLGAPEGALFVADFQTQGRGRRGRSWNAEPGESLMFSLVLRPRLDLEKVPALTLCVGLAVRDALAAFIAPTLRIKWPNDIVAGKQKLGGILLESSSTPGGSASTGTAVVVGVGVNVHTRSFAPSIAHSATSLALLGSSRDRAEVLCAVLEQIERRLTQIETQGLGATLADYEYHDALMNRRVRGEDGISGVAVGVSAHGALLVQQESGGIASIHAGTVELL